MTTNEFRITHISISSSRKNIKDMASFYSALLDLDFKYTYPLDWPIYTFKLLDLTIEIIESSMRRVEAKNNRVMLSIEVNDIHTRVESALKIGGGFTHNFKNGIGEHDGKYHVCMIDPDGNQINLSENK